MKQVLPRFLSPTKFRSCFWFSSFRAFLADDGRFSTPFDPSTERDLLRPLPASDFGAESLDSSSPLTTFPLQTLTSPSLLSATVLLLNSTCCRRYKTFFFFSSSSTARQIRLFIFRPKPGVDLIKLSGINLLTLFYKLYLFT